MTVAESEGRFEPAGCLRGTSVRLDTLVHRATSNTMWSCVPVSHYELRRDGFPRVGSVATGTLSHLATISPRARRLQRFDTGLRRAVPTW